MSLHFRWAKNKFQKQDCSIPQLKAIHATFSFRALIFVYERAAK